jgi:MoaA/NifB/PqqE/SkfB family radical SAM enzyme
VPIPTVGIYGGSKSALALMANTMRLELAPAGITVINVYPGTVRTAFEVNAPREKGRPGLDPAGRSGRSVGEIAARIVGAAKGPGGEVWLEREGRWMATAALLWPSLVERRLQPLRDRALAHEEGSREGKPAAERRWHLWQVESSMACHLRCVMCPWKDVRDGAGEALMSDAVWDIIREHLPEIASVDFSGGGEPLLHPRLFERIAEAKACGSTAGFLTNGMKLDEEASQSILTSGTDWVAVSVDGSDAPVYEAVRTGASFDTVTGNIRRLAALRAGQSPRLAINFVMMPMNVHQLEELVRLAADLGVDQVNFKQCDVVRGEHGRGFGLFASREERELRRYEKALARARRLARRLKIETTAFSFVPEELPVCDQDPRSSLFIRYDGKVAPCINQAYGGEVCFMGRQEQMPTVHYGSLPEQDPLELWEGDLCSLYRRTFDERVKAHDAKLISSGVGSSMAELKEVFASARDAMPPPPTGCHICHYLYDI